MSPEQIEGKDADARSDIFAFGSVLYEMVTGRRPFAGKSQISLASSILEKDPEPISAIKPLTPPALEHVLTTCLQKNPEERFQTAHDIKLELQWIAADRSAPAVAGLPPSPSHTRERLGWATALVATLAALGLAAVHFSAAPRVEPVVRSSILPPAGGAFVMMAVESGPPVLSPDGTRLAFTARDEKGKVALYVRPLNSTTAQPLTGTEEAMYPFWSPDSREIGFFASGKLRRIDAAGGPPQTVCDALNGRGGAWSKDGVIVFTPTTNAALLRVPASGGTPEPASKLDASRAENSHRWPFFLPDGKHFLYWARTSQGYREYTGNVQGNALYVGELGSLQAKQLMKSETMAEYASGHLLFMREQTLMARPFNVRTLEVRGEAVPVAEHIAINGAVARPIFSASENDSLIYQSGETAGNWNLEWVARDGKPVGAVAQPDRYFYPALSPDGARLAVNLFNSTQGTQDIWIFDLARGTKTRLTFGPANQLSPAWSPDGKTIVYQSNAKGGYHIYSKAADGSGAEQKVLESEDAQEAGPRFSPDGRYLVYLRRPNTGSQPSIDLWALPLFGDRKPIPIVQSAFDKGGAAISPDGKWLAYHTSDSGRNEVYITAFPGAGAKWQFSTNGGIEAHWRKDGKELFFLDPTDNLVAVDVNIANNAPQLGVPHILFQANAIHRQSGPYDVTGNGKKFLVNTGNLKEGSDPLTLVLNWPAELKK
jgi:eukaryotic-like serine/threonine-protein kinase